MRYVVVQKPYLVPGFVFRVVWDCGLFFLYIPGWYSATFPQHWKFPRGARAIERQAAIREHLIVNLGVTAEELDPPCRQSLGRGRFDGEGSGEMYDDDKEEMTEGEDGQQVPRSNQPMNRPINPLINHSDQHLDVSHLLIFHTFRKAC